MIETLMISAKLATPGVFKMKDLKFGYDAITYIHNLIKKTLSRELNYIVDMVMWPTFVAKIW